MAESPGAAPRRGTFQDLFRAELKAISEIRKSQAELPTASEAEAVAAGDASGATAQFIQLRRQQFDLLNQTLARLPETGETPAAESAKSDASPTPEAGESQLEPGTYQRCAVNPGTQPGHQEPFVDFVADDLVGLALSGGGIRSATFNLGLLQGLHALKLLPLFDYLSTVSGGGYIGGWWLAWRHRIAGSDADWFPESKSGREAEEVRHIREFSNFLIPHLGFFRTDMWSGIVAVLSGIVATLSGTLALMLAALLLWTLSVFLYSWPVVGAVVFAAATGLIVMLCERQFRRRVGVFTDADSLGRDPARRYAWGATVVSFLVAACLPPHLEFLCDIPDGARLWTLSTAWHGFRQSLTFPVAGLSAPWLLEMRPGISGKPQLFFPAVGWLLTAVVLMLFRYYPSWSLDPNRNRAVVTASSRVIGRLLATALIWLVAAVIWVVASWLWSESQPAVQLATGGLTALGIDLFRRSKKWVSESGSRSQTGRIMDLIRPLIPQLLAYGVLGLCLILLSGPVSWILQDETGGFLPGAFFVCGTIVLVLARWLSPEAVGLHAFYRGRLARAYLGASNRQLHNPQDHKVGQPVPASVNRQSITHQHDDLPLHSLSKPGRGPLHLICCAANDLAGDPLQNLGRGSRSTVLSARGVAMGNSWAEDRDLTLGTAQTASAAAFNSNMGSVSTRLGPAVCLLATALNLRLGLWLRHPGVDAIRSPKWRGWRFFKEMFGQTHSGWIPKTRSDQKITEWQLSSPDVHLSDGGHFENLSLYELVRRHCRYIIVSDCGADPEVAFDDLGNALRRIRHDFDVEIEIDVEPLKPQSNGLAKQHMAVGTIHYNRTNDKGILLYFKPNLTGDEPDDIQQYKTRNGRFPNETTGDQFYDESQWESYRRLGEHAARSSLRFVERLAGENRSVQSIFSRAYWHYAPTPDDLKQNMVQQSERFRSFLDRLDRLTDQAVLTEALPQCQPIGAAAHVDPEAETDRAAHRNVDATAPPATQVLTLLLEMAQLMEDVYHACSLDSHWNHPLNHGWMNLFRRWAQSRAFRTWWPVIQSLYGSEFREFVNRELHLHRRTPACHSGEERRRLVRSVGPEPPAGLAFTAWQEEHEESWPPRPYDAVYVLDYPLTPSWQTPADAAVAEHPHVQLALMGLQVGKSPEHGDAAWWTPADVFVPPSLWSTGIAETLLRSVLDRLSKNEDALSVAPQRCVVLLPGVKPDEGSPRLKYSDQGSRRAHADLIRFYTMLGFQLVRRGAQEFLVQEFV